MISICTDPDLMYRIANSDGVRESVGIDQDGQRDWETWATLPPEESGVFCLTNGVDALGVADLYNGGQGLISGKVMGHWAFAVTCRGKRALETGRAMIAWLHNRGYDVWGSTPYRNRKAIWFNKRLGGRELPTSTASTINFEWQRAA